MRLKQDLEYQTQVMGCAVKACRHPSGYHDVTDKPELTLLIICVPPSFNMQVNQPSVTEFAQSGHIPRRSHQDNLWWS